MLALIAAESREFAGLLRHTGSASKLDWPVSFARRASLRGKAILLIANGPGPKLAAQAVNAALEHGEVDGLVSVGFCGALDPELAPCDIFVATEVLGAGPALAPAGLSRPYRSGKLLSIDRVASMAGEKAELRKTGADAVEMEAAAVAERARFAHIPFYAIKVVTDAAGESFPLDFNRVRDADGRFDRGRILLASLRKPRIFPALLQLKQRCNAAAQALGDFIADTRF